MDAVLYAYGFLLGVATLCVFLGSLLSLRTPEAKTQALDSKAAKRFPFLAALTLGSLFVLLKVLPPELVNVALRVYFVGAVVVAGGSALQVIPEALFPSLARPALAGPWTEKLIGEPISWSFLPSAAAILAVALAWVRYGGWPLNNVLAVFLSIVSIAELRVTSFSAGALLMAALFLYDVVMVFGKVPGLGESVMVTVATSIDAPIKLLFPRDIADPDSRSAMLGLGDIVIPGVFVAYTARFDAERSAAGARPHVFVWTMAGYVIALTACMGVMHVFAHPQPALLYISPAVLLFASLGALAWGGKSGVALLWTSKLEEEASHEASGKHEDTNPAEMLPVAAAADVAEVADAVQQ
jgi:minor histocompatibility antigen H13